MANCDGSGGCGDGCCGGLGGKGTDPFIDRSKVRILLCDNDSKSSGEVRELLCKCSYQVTSVRSARQVIDALNAEGPDIDIILSEIDIPMKKGMKMLKYITRDKDLQRIPVIMMSTKDEVTLVVKCLRLGAADYLVKPLRTNELLNLWTHMWRRRRMLGLPEKNILSYDLEVVASDPSDANTNSTTLFSDDTDDKTRKNVNPEVTVANHQEYESFVSPPGTVFPDSSQPHVPGISDRRRGAFSSFPKKSDLKIGESSAFFTYVKSSMQRNNTQGVFTSDGSAPQPSKVDQQPKTQNGQVYHNSTRVNKDGETIDINSQVEDFPSSTSFPDSTSMERSCTPPVSLELRRTKSNDEGTSQVHMQQCSNGTHHDASGFIPHAPYPYFIPGMINQVLMPPSAHIYQKNHPNTHSHENSAVVPQYNNIPQCPSHIPGMPSFPYYPVSICAPPGQASSNHKWPSFGSASSGETKVSKVDRREVALMKFRQKRKERCFDKKIRYVNRKKLAERRPRVRGQFVRKVNGVTVDLNGEPSSADMEDYEEDDPASRDYSPDDDAL